MIIAGINLNLIDEFLKVERPCPFVAIFLNVLISIKFYLDSQEPSSSVTTPASVEVTEDMGVAC